MVPPADSLQHTTLDHGAYLFALRQLLQCGAIDGATTGSRADPLHGSWRNYWTCHASVHVAHVHDCAQEDPAAELRDVLVYAPSIPPLLVGDVYACDGMLRERLRLPGQSV